MHAKYRAERARAWSSATSHPGLMAAVLAGLIVLMSASAVAAEAGHKLPDRAQAHRLIRTTLSTLHDANRTENYSVFRSLASPQFQKVFTSEKLSELFETFRKNRIDVSRLVDRAPKIERATVRGPASEQVQFEGILLWARAHRVRFSFTYQFSENQWKLHGLALVRDSIAPQPVKTKAEAPLDL